jgi:regulator of protease activity HflC (stomatin/prohibitin superfamily)
MGWFIFSIILLVIAVIVGFGSFAAKDEGALGMRVGAAVLTVLAVGMFVLSGLREVPTRSVGVPTSFGKVESSLRPGIHFKAPWTTVNILDETIQTTTFDGNDCLTVRIGGQQTACLDVTIQWRILDSGAPGLFNDYNGSGSSNTSSSVQPSSSVPSGIMGNITDAVVIRELEQTVNEVLGDYNPIQDVSANATAGNSQFSGFGPVVESDMRRDLTGRIQVLNVLMPLLRYDTATQDRLNQIQQQYGQTAIAQQEVATNKAQSAANAAISASLSSNPGVLEYQCLQITQDALKSGDTLPAGWSCTGSSSSLALSTGK